jgi:hypothetical protein
MLLKKAATAVARVADSVPLRRGTESMMGARQGDQAAVFYEFSLDRHVPAITS